MKHRPDIDGLRAVAIVPVILFHARVGVPGGFTGVDVFFVISGFLITGVLLADIERDRFSVGRFYERRVRRILPALFTVAMAASLATPILMPADAADFGRSLVATMSFCSNVFFLRHTGYFEAPADTKPLLHTWSLAVEEQFYIVYPLLLYAAIRVFRKRYDVVLAVLLVASFAYSVWGVHAFRPAAFYLAPMRGWELLLGAVLASGAIPPLRSPALAGLLAIVGLSSLVYGFAFLSGSLPFPGVNALYPTVGTALLIYTGAESDTLVRRALSVKPVVFVGLISYSLYLWHWVLIVLVKYYTVARLTPLSSSIVIGGSLVLAAVSWRFVENPFRGRRGLIGSRRALFGAAAAVAIAIAAYGGLLFVRHGFPARFDRPVLEALAASRDFWPRRDECANRICRIGDTQSAPEFLLWGDSHAGAIAPAFEDLAKSGNLAGAVAYAPMCAPLLGLERYDQDDVERCARWNRSVLDYIRTNRIATVFVHARWGLYAEGVRYEDEDGIPLLLTPRRDPADDFVRFQAMFRATMRELHDLHVDVVVIASVPEIGIDVPMALAREAVSGRERALGPFTAELRARQARAEAVMSESSRLYGFPVIDPAQVLCDATSCEVVRDSRPLYSDTSHLTEHGARYLEPLLSPLLTRGASRTPSRAP